MNIEFKHKLTLMFEGIEFHQIIKLGSHYEELQNLQKKYNRKVWK